MAEDKKPLPIAEIVTGVVIVIILILYALPRFIGWVEGSVVGNEASKLFYNLAAAKKTAVENKHRVWVEFEGTSSYTIFEDVNGNGIGDPGEPARHIKLNPNIQFGINPDPPIQNVWGTGTVAKPIDFVGGKTKFYFKPSSKASRTGAVYFITKTDMGNSNADIRAVKIIGASGEISVLKISPGDSPPWK